MARSKDEKLSPEARANRQIRRFLANAFLLALSLAVLVAWAWFGFYQLEPGQSAVILRFGEYAKTVETPGLKWHLPPPIETDEVVSVDEIEREVFGIPATTDAEAQPGLAWASAMQTSDNNIVQLEFVVHYRVKDPFFARYRVASPREILRDAAEAAVREVVGRTSIDGVLSERRGEVESESEEVLQEILDRYQTGLLVLDVNLQEVQPPAAVRQAFDDVIAAAQDRSRTINEAEGYANEVVPRARGEASELVEGAQGYREAKIAEATGEAARFRALVKEYLKAPEVTRTRLYLETMEAILPGVEKVIVEPGSNVLPYLPVGRGVRDGGSREGEQ
jgi:membrane protease subunit HflK